MSDSGAEATDRKSASGVRPRRGPWRLAFALAFILVAVAAAAALKLAQDRSRAISLAFAQQAREANDAGDHAKALLWALMGLPQKGELIGPRSQEARIELLRAYGNNRLLHVLKGYSSRVRRASFSPDGKSVLTVSSREGAMLWDAETGKLIRVLAGKAVTCAEFHPVGGQVLIAFYNGTVQIRDLKTDSILINIKGHAAPVDFAGFSPDGAYVATELRDGTVKLWNAESGALFHTLQAPQDDGGKPDRLISDVEGFSPDGKRLLTESRFHSLQIWNVRTGKLQVTLSGEHSVIENYIGKAVFSPSGGQVAAAVWDGTARVWDTETGRQRCLLEGHAGSVRDIAYSPAGDVLVTIAANHLVRFWDPKSCRPVRTLAGRPTDAALENINYSRPFTSPRAVFSPDGARLVTTVGNSAQLWDVKSGDRLESFAGHEGEVFSMAFSPDGARLVTGSWDGTARLWTARPPALITMLEGHDPGWVALEDRLAFDPAGRRLATAPQDKTARLWDAQTGNPEHVLRGHEDIVRHVAFNRSGTRLITAANDGARVWEVQSGSLLTVLKGESPERAILSDAGTRALSYTWTNSVSLWDAQTGRRLNSFRVGEMKDSGAVLDIAFSPDGPRVLTRKNQYGPKTQIRIPQTTSWILWDAETGEPVKTVTTPGSWYVNGAFSRQGTHLITSRLMRNGGDSAARIWKAGSGTPVMTLNSDIGFTVFPEFDWARRRLIAVHHVDVGIWDLESGKRRQMLSGDLGYTVAAAHAAPDLVFTASGGGGAWLWDVPSGRILRDFSDKMIRVHYAAINRDGTRIATISQDNRVRLWEVSPIYRAGLREQVRMACALAARTGAAEFSESDRQNLLLRGRPVNPCNRPGLLSGTFYKKIAGGWFGNKQ